MNRSADVSFHPTPSVPANRAGMGAIVLDEKNFRDPPAEWVGVSSWPCWQTFQEMHGEWFAKRERESEWVYPLRLEEQVRGVYQSSAALSDADVSAEEAYWDLCRRFGAVTWGKGVPLKSPIMHKAVLNPPDDKFDPQLLQLMLSLGWTEHHVRAVPQLIRGADHALERTWSIAGRCICQQEFLDQLESLKSLWRKLPQNVRPNFPFALMPESGAAPQSGRKITHPQRIEFYSQLQQFLNHWKLMQLTTWDLPEPQGLVTIDPVSFSRGELSSTIPPSFPLQREDELSPTLATAHDHRARAQGIDDLTKFETYAQIWKINFFDAILQRRYGAAGQSMSVTERRGVLAELLLLSSDRIKKYLTFRNGLRSGHRSSLKECR